MKRNTHIAVADRPTNGLAFGRKIIISEDGTNTLALISAPGAGAVNVYRLKNTWEFFYRIQVLQGPQIW